MRVRVSEDRVKRTKVRLGMREEKEVASERKHEFYSSGSHTDQSETIDSSIVKGKNLPVTKRCMVDRWIFSVQVWELRVYFC